MNTISGITEFIIRRSASRRLGRRGLRQAMQWLVTVIVAFIVLHRLFPGFDPVRVVQRTFEDKSASFVELGIKSLQQQTPGGAKTAITYFTKALEADPQNPEIYYYRSRAWYAMDDTKERMADLEKAIEIDPGYAPAYYEIGSIYQYKMEGKLEDALTNYSKAIQLKPDYLDAIGSRASVYEEMQRLDESIADYNLLVTLMPENIGPEAGHYIHTSRARLYMAKNMVREAIAAYHAAIDADPYNAHIIRYMVNQFPEQIEAIDPASETFAEYEALLRRIDETWESNHE